MLTLLQQVEEHLANVRLASVVELGRVHPQPYNGDYRLEGCETCRTPLMQSQKARCPFCGATPVVLVPVYRRSPERAKVITDAITLNS